MRLCPVALLEGVFPLLVQPAAGSFLSGNTFFLPAAALAWGNSAAKCENRGWISIMLYSRAPGNLS
jgi:hypothetical protein